MKLLAIHRSVVLCCACVALISGAALVGWTFDCDGLKGVAPGFIAMNPLTATLLLVASASVWLRREQITDRRIRTAGSLLGCCVAAAGGLRLAGYMFDLPLEIDRVLFAEALGDNRMAPNTSLCLLILGLGLATWDYVTGRGFWLAQTCALTVAVIATACLVGYAYGTKSLYQVSSFIPMALNTAVGLLCASLGLLFADARRGVLGLLLSAGEGGRLARLLFPTALGIPFFVGWARIAGEQAGWYDARFGTAITVTAMMILLVAAVSLASASLNRSDAARREAADRLVGVNAELETRVHERTAELSRANRLLARQAAELAATNADLVHKNDENEMFVYSVSHDLRSPLVNLQGFSNELSANLRDLQALLANVEVTPDAHRRGQCLVGDEMPRSIHFIQTAVGRLGGIIDALLRLSRAGRVEHQPQIVYVAEVVHRVIASMAGTIFDRGAEITVDSLPDVYGDATAVEQVFANLIGNAVNYLDASRPGKITIGSQPAQRATGDDGNWTMFFVADNGQGIAEAYHAKVFQALKRLHPKSGQGEGIGLAIARRIVERHGGSAWFESTPGVGSTFYVTFPSSAAAGRALGDDVPAPLTRSHAHAEHGIGNLAG